MSRNVSLFQSLCLFYGRVNKDINDSQRILSPGLTISLHKAIFRVLTSVQMILLGLSKLMTQESLNAVYVCLSRYELMNSMNLFILVCMYSVCTIYSYLSTLFLFTLIEI